MQGDLEMKWEVEEEDREEEKVEGGEKSRKEDLVSWCIY